MTAASVVDKPVVPGGALEREVEGHGENATSSHLLNGELHAQGRVDRTDTVARNQSLTLASQVGSLPPMGRYLSGDHGFRYKYLFAEQDSNLSDLRDGPGRAWLVPAFAVTSHARETTELIPLMPIVRAALANVDEETAFDDFVTGSDAAYTDFASVVRAVEPNFALLALHLDDHCPWAADTMTLVARAHFELRRSDWEALRGWIEEQMPSGTLSFEMLRRDPPPPEVDALRDVEGALPWLGFWILRHAVQNDLEILNVWEDAPSLATTPRLWDQCFELMMFADAGERDGADWAFTKALAGHLAGASRASEWLRVALESGSLRAARWIAMSGDGPPSKDPPTEQKPPRLSELIARNEAAAEVRSAFRGSDAARSIGAIEVAARHPNPHLFAEILLVIAERGSIDEARTVLTCIVPVLDDDTRQMEIAYILEIALRAGEHEKAFEWLRELYEKAQRESDDDTLAFIEGEPTLAPLRQDPRWKQFFA